MAKTLCDWSKRDIEKKADKLYELVRDPKFICRKCARVASQYQVLCKPKRMPALSREPESAPDSASAIPD